MFTEQDEVEKNLSMVEYIVNDFLFRHDIRVVFIYNLMKQNV